jgi:polyisoprenoid-binding protein YceI
MTIAVSPSRTTTWQIDPAHTLVEFGVKHLMISTVKGRFAGVTGTLVVDEDDSAGSSVQVEIDAASIDTRQEQRDAHLRSADFLEAERHPTITFKSTRVEPLGEDRFRVVGDLTIRGTTREVVLDAELTGRGTYPPPYSREAIGFTASTAIDRTEFGLTYNTALETGGFMVGDTVKIHLEVEANPAA